jgi:hypothetical protein
MTNKHFYSFFLTFLFIAFAFVGNAQKTIKFNNERNQLTVLEDNYQRLQVQNLISEIKFKKIKTEQGEFYDMIIDGYSWSHDYGSPKLPVIRKIIEIPQGAKFEVQTLSYVAQEFDLKDYNVKSDLYPSQLAVPKDPNLKPEFKYNGKRYAKNEYYSKDLVSVEYFGEMRGTRLARLNIAPVEYNPVTNKIIVYKDIVVQVDFDNSNVEATKQAKERNFSPYFQSLNNLVLNAKPFQPAMQKSNITSYPVKYVIVADTMFRTALQPFVDWKTKKGFKVIEAYTSDPQVGGTTTSIKNYLQGLYNAGTVSDPAPSFVLFVGDIGQIPSFSGGMTSGSHVSDLYFCEYTGDTLPEVFYGRFSATSLSELTPQINKTLQYEQFLFQDPGFLNHSVLIAGDDNQHGPVHANGQINYAANTYFNTSHGITSHTYLYPSSSSNATQIRNDVNNGAGFVNYTAHGYASGWADPSFNNTHIPSMTNEGEYPLMIGNACLTNKFNVNECFGEALLRANNKGALGYIGASNNTYWDEDFWWSVGFGTVSPNPNYSSTNLGAYDRMFHDHGEPFADWFVTQGQMIFAGNLGVMQGASKTDINYYWEIYHLMGDPSLSVYFSIPPQLNATYAQMIPLNLTSFTVNTEPYAYVGVSMNDTLHGAALADSNGVAIVQLDSFAVAGTADVIATKQNRKPYIGTVTVAYPNGPYIIYYDHDIDDATGNNNGSADFGETIDLDIILRNLTSYTASQVTAKLTSNDSYIQITDSLESWNQIQSNDTAKKVAAFDFKVNDFVPDNHIVSFTLEVQDSAGGYWTSSFAVRLYAPVLDASVYSIDDSNGNNNGKLDQGETVDIIIDVKNTGHADADSTAVTLVSSNGKVLVLSGSSTLNTVAAGGTKQATYQLKVDNNAWNGTVTDLTFSAQSGLYSDQNVIKAMIGKVDEDFETNSFTKYAWNNGGSMPWTIISVNPYEGQYSAQSGNINDMDTSILSIN